MFVLVVFISATAIAIRTIRTIAVTDIVITVIIIVVVTLSKTYNNNYLIVDLLLL